MPVQAKNRNGENLELLDWISLQDSLINETKTELALIEVTSKAGTGTLQFDLPANLRRNKNPNRSRRDLYACTLMACWGAKCYWDLLYKEQKPQDTGFAFLV